MALSRGDIVTLNLNPAKGHEVGKIRPGVVLSGDDENTILETVIVMPLSTKLLDDKKPYRLRIKAREGLKHDSDLLVNQIRSLSQDRIGEKIGRIRPEEYEEIIQCLCANF
jgi:mRNA interferase MazF